MRAVFEPPPGNHIPSLRIKRPEPRRGVEVVASWDDYRRHAADCVRLAQKAQNPRDKALLLAMAECWIRLAEEAAKRDQRIKTEARK
jgi:hypothetical protein